VSDHEEEEESEDDDKEEEGNDNWNIGCLSNKYEISLETNGEWNGADKNQKVMRETMCSKWRQQGSGEEKLRSIHCTHHTPRAILLGPAWSMFSCISLLPRIAGGDFGS
jgi:hypothetical protein